MNRAIPVIVVVAFLALTRCGGGSTTNAPAGSDREQPSATTAVAGTAWKTHLDEGRGLQVTYPSDWYLAEDRLTPNLGDPLEIVSLGTYPLRAGGDRCPHHPVNALEDLGPDDAFVSILERAPPYPPAGYPPRPSRFELPTKANTGMFCVPSSGRFDEWLAFSDGGRAFYLLVALGESASEKTRADLLTILNSLTIEEGR